MANFWQTVKGAFEKVTEWIQGGEAPTAPVHQEVRDIIPDPDPFQKYYVETDEEKHDRVSEFEDMIEWLEDAPTDGYDFSGEFLTPADLADPEDLRLVRYSTAEEAFEFLVEAGISHFSEIIYFPEEDLYGIAVGDSPSILETA